MNSEKIHARFREVFSLKWDNASPEEIRSSILSGSKLQGTNMCILILAIFIASIGLNMNSTAVIIGAMLISPLMGGIIAIGYGIATDDLSFAKLAAFRLTFQVTICIVTSALYFTISPISTAHSELLARISPTIWDVLIAICGGFAGIIGLTRKEKGNVIPGVAIATALMPPLCTAGYGLATLQLKFFLGALYLFFINGFFICLTSIIVMRLLKLPCKEIINEKARTRLHRNIKIIAIVTIIPSVIFAWDIVIDSMFDNNVNNYINNEFDFEDTQLVQYKVDKDNNTLEVALLGKRIDDNTIKKLQNDLSNYNLSNIELHVTQTEVSDGITSDEIEKLIAKEIDNTDNKDELEKLKSENIAYKAQLSKLDSEKFDYEKITKELKALYPQIKSCSIGTQHSYDTSNNSSNTDLVLILSLPAALTDQEKNQITSWIKASTETTYNIKIMEEIS
ncbi:DUF389 domain-containing protein [Clostridium sp. HCP1S3_B4]|uniref:DUF389 domain-containing protein n=1 Tax=unclassified Clostridium TaxID=2614128 RepID=UPI0016988D19|nr:DUF389 domain-containing protein [Clostridiales bacterium]MDY2730170.1 DUF389 domain-containing protein [Clostridium sp.]NLK23357.1 DUF389 domain-containing protein [Clostridiales bacterium]